MSKDKSIKIQCNGRDAEYVNNAIMCPCDKKEVIQSKSRHDFVKCSCGQTFIDGGGDGYTRVGYNPEYNCVYKLYAVKEEYNTYKE